MVVEATTTLARRPIVALARMFQAPQRPSTDSESPSTSTRPLPDERQEERERDERNLEHEPPEQVAEIAASDATTSTMAARPRTPRTPLVGHDHHEDERELGDQLRFWREPVDRAVTVEVERVGVRTGHAGDGGAAERRARTVRIVANSSSPTPNVTTTPMMPARPVLVPSSSTPRTP